MMLAWMVKLAKRGKGEPRFDVPCRAVVVDGIFELEYEL
jgi:hypothetical protein